VVARDEGAAAASQRGNLLQAAAREGT
jgi:hypothetical protein